MTNRSSSVLGPSGPVVSSPASNLAVGSGFPTGTRLATEHETAATTAILLVPHDGPLPEELFLKARHWVEVTDGAGELLVQTITLQHATIIWQPQRAAIIANANTGERLVSAVARFTMQELELQAIESWIGASWPQLTADAPLAFEYDQRSQERRSAVAKQFQETIAWRARWARLVPEAHQPPIYPPTLASQVSERLRERTRLSDRVDFVGTQLDLFDRVYDQCAARVSEFVVAQRGHQLEWVIIVLLSFQTIMLLLEHFVVKSS